MQLQREISALHHAVVSAGDEAYRIYRRYSQQGHGVPTLDKDDGSPVTEVDRVADRIMHEILGPVGPDFYSEERTARPPLDCGNVYVVDPVDNTVALKGPGNEGQFCHMGALLNRGQVIAGAVYEPHGKTLFTAELGYGAFMQVDGSIERVRLKVDAGANPDSGSIVVLRGADIPSRLAELVESKGWQTRRIGGLGLKLMDMAQGNSHVHARCNIKADPARQPKVTDTAAPGLIFNEAHPLGDPGFGRTPFGVFTDEQGRSFSYTGTHPGHRIDGFVAASSRRLHGIVMDCLRGVDFPQ